MNTCLVLLGSEFRWGSDDESHRNEGVESMSEDPEGNDSGSSEGFEIDGHLDSSHSDDEDIEFNGRSNSENFVHLRSYVVMV
ncbi:U3 small nucleolar RNA-associated protein 25 [Senna tora]|uniref:U3 small nucleolar RNA-associated protein 25 n=1 Tax=Senna tora TaxID=362788 RepID=A0A835CJP0_9FABA|nr:U3 small nucleolar RNA-associated protein 25 [Senna tora]